MARAWMGSISSGNKIFFAGGQNDDWPYSNVDFYDIETNSWRVTYLSRQTDALAAASVGNKVFFAGGNWGIYATDAVDIFDLNTNTWSSASLSIPRNFVSGVSLNNKVYFSGGDLKNGQASNVIDIYDNTTGTWSTKNLKFPRAFNAAVAVGEKIFFAGGSIGSTPQSTCSVEIFDTNTGASVLNNLFFRGSWFPDAGKNTLVKDNKIIFLRQEGRSSFANKFDIYDTQNNSWAIGVLSQPIPADAAVISANNTIYVAGGWVNDVLSDLVWKLEF